LTVNMVLMKVFVDARNDRMPPTLVGLLQMETLIAERKQKLLTKFAQCDNVLPFAYVESV